MTTPGQPEEESPPPTASSSAPATPAAPTPLPAGSVRLRERRGSESPLGTDAAFARENVGNFLLGIVNANVLAGLLMTLTMILMEHAGEVIGSYGYAATILIPFAMGLMAAYTWRSRRYSGRAIAGGALLNTLVGVAVAYTFLHEGTVCLGMGFPIIYLVNLLGSALGTAAFRREQDGALHASIVPVILILVVVDAATPKRDVPRVVTTTAVIAAPAAVVFPHLVAFPPIPGPPPASPLNLLGLPWPVETTASAAQVGARRDCRFSGGLDIGERITRLVPGREIVFDIVNPPRYPEFTGHGSLVRGRMRVTDNGDGTCTITGTTWFTLRVYPDWYFGPCADSVIHGVHRRVFDQIARLAAADVARTGAH
jgi:hypothetical protein